MCRKYHNQKRCGAVIVLVAFMFVALLGITALVTDIGYMRVSRVELQNAADGAAMAAALAVSVDSSNAGQVLASQAGIDCAMENTPH